MNLSRSIILLLVLCTCSILIPAGVSGSENGILVLSIKDKSTEAEVAARIRIRDNTGKDHFPDDAAVVPIARDKWFCAYSPIRLSVPAGRISLRVERGTEYQPVKESLTIKAGHTTQHKVVLHRWVNMRKRGYVSGENHLHVPMDKLPAMLAAEDLDFGTSLSWWNGPKFNMVPETEWEEKPEFGNKIIPTSIYDAEVEHSWGAVYIIGLPKPVSIASDSRRSNLPFVQAARDQGALICYQAGWSREVLVDALLGYVDVVNVCNNNFHRYMYQPRKRYSNLLNVEGFPQYPNTPDGMYQMNCETYYRLLNCGLQIAAGAGSATGAKTTPVGYNRAYVRAGKRPTLTQFLDAWRKGKNFVTNGPMIFLRTDQGKQPGDIIDLPQEGKKMAFQISALSEQPLRSLEVVANGEVVKKAQIDSKQHEAKLNVTLNIKEGTWVAARCTEEDQFLSDKELTPYRWGGSLPAEPCRLRFAHTSPIYFKIGGKGPRVASSLQEAKKMLQAFKAFAQKTASPKYLPEILDILPQDVEIQSEVD